MQKNELKDYRIIGIKGSHILLVSSKEYYHLYEVVPRFTVEKTEPRGGRPTMQTVGYRTLLDLYRSEGLEGLKSILQTGRARLVCKYNLKYDSTLSVEISSIHRLISNFIKPYTFNIKLDQPTQPVDNNQVLPQYDPFTNTINTFDLGQLRAHLRVDHDALLDDENIRDEDEDEEEDEEETT